MKQLFHLKSRNLNETNLTSSKAKTLNEPISVREIARTEQDLLLPLPPLIRPGSRSRIRTQTRNSREPEQDNSICSFNLKGTRAEALELHSSSSRRA